MVTEGVILAAGCSSRTAPDCKLAFMLDGQSVLERSIGSMKPFCSRIFVVTGAHEERIRDIVNGQQSITLVHNPDFMRGMYGSVKTGLRSTTGGRVFILPGDCPFVTPDVYRALLAAEGEIVLPVWKGHAGHPVLLSRPIISNLLRDECHESLRQFISVHPYTTVTVHSDGILRDIDTEAEYRRALRQTTKTNDRR